MNTRHSSWLYWVHCAQWTVFSVFVWNIQHYALHDCAGQDCMWDSDPEAVDDIGDIEVPPLPQFSSQRHRSAIEMIMTLVTFHNFATNKQVGCLV